jgi:hypothetical protein
MLRLVLSMTLLLLLPACSRTPSVDLPRLAAVGPAAADLGVDTVTVTVTADGRIFTPEGETTGVALVTWLAPRANRSRDQSIPQQPSHVHLVVRGDRAAALFSVYEVLMAACDPTVRMNRVVFAVRSSDPADRAEGTFAHFLPLDGGLVGFYTSDRDPVLRIDGDKSLEDELLALSRRVGTAGRSKKLVGVTVLRELVEPIYGE